MCVIIFNYFLLRERAPCALGLYVPLMAEGRSCESEVFTSKVARLKRCINPNDLITKCYSEGIIGAEDFEEAVDATTRPQKATILLRAVEKSIETDPAVFKKFLSVLGSEATNRRLVEELGTHLLNVSHVVCMLPSVMTHLLVLVRTIDAAIKEKRLAQAPPPPKGKVGDAESENTTLNNECTSG